MPQSFKKLNAHLKKGALAPQEWLFCGDVFGRVYDIRELDNEKDKYLLTDQEQTA